MAKNNRDSRLWDGITEDDFKNENIIEPTDIADFDLKYMTLFGSNVNLFRQLIRLSDSLKPVERRILYALYKAKAFPGHKLKSNMINGYTAVYHCHGDSYPSMVGMAQSWKKQCPLVDGKGNFGSAANDMYAANRYTEACMSQYAKECFFDDYDEDCIEMVFNGASDQYEPMSFPAKFPNILVNGGMGIAFGNSFRIPCYNIYDIIANCTKIIQNPDAEVFMIPDLPSGCQIVDDGHSFQDIVSTGKGTLKMRATAEIIEGNKNWIIKFTSLPWMTTLASIESKIVELAEAGTITIKDKQDHSYAVKGKDGKVITKVDFRVIVDKAHDPYNILNKLYSTTELQKSVSIDFKVVLDNLTVARLNMRELISSWLDERRSYKRRLFNKRLNKIAARIDILDILIYLLKDDNIEKTIRIIRNSDSSEAIEQLRKLGRMNSYQASKIYEMRLSAFTKDARKKYKDERETLQKEYNNLLKVIGSEKKIDEIILDELKDLEKYASPRKSEIISEESGTKIMDTMHTVVITNNSMIKKIAYDPNNPAKNNNLGSFKTGDYPISRIVVHNTSNLIFLDSLGRYSIIPVHQIDNTELSHYGNKAYNITKLYGKIVCCMEEFDADLLKRLKKKVGTPYLVTITANGYAKKTPLSVFTEMKNTKNIRAIKIRNDDTMICADIMFDSSIILIYTKKGEFITLKVSDIAEQAKDSMGLMTIKVPDGDSVAGVSIISSATRENPMGNLSVCIISEKGMTKIVDSPYLGDLSRRSKNQGKIITLDQTDNVRFIIPIDWSMRPQKLMVATRSNVQSVDIDNIPNTTKKSKGKALIFPGASSLVAAEIVYKRVK